ncbi:hypothetical protein B9Q03_12605 [Candidatus Marsarchaeota G2 archaeon OSP_D]|jgi:hypothetical protein|uniref:Uncharacterized protein n=1 Tax=Candidatus Marsarchaeota G2 archaeon OSP_D TaxID=1978157 RepID=A0A2R6AFA0_9ARCH|nr:MAG: hypothetical protein B9Q03_12605 [Candidatus Marsarchaeota G2 archaeon OSP_D]
MASVAEPAELEKTLNSFLFSKKEKYIVLKGEDVDINEARRPCFRLYRSVLVDHLKFCDRREAPDRLKELAAAIKEILSDQVVTYYVMARDFTLTPVMFFVMTYNETHQRPFYLFAETPGRDEKPPYRSSFVFIPKKEGIRVWYWVLGPEPSKRGWLDPEDLKRIQDEIFAKLSIILPKYFKWDSGQLYYWLFDLPKLIIPKVKADPQAQ